MRESCHVSAFAESNDRESRVHGCMFRVVGPRSSVVFVSNHEAIDIIFRNHSQLFIAQHHETAPRIIGGVKSRHHGEFVKNILIPIVIKGTSELGLCEILPTFNSRLHRHLTSSCCLSSRNEISLVYLISYSLYSSIVIAFFGDSFPVNTYDDLMLLDSSVYRAVLGLPFPPSSIGQAQGRSIRALQEFMKPWKESQGSQDMDGVSSHGNDVARALMQAPLSDHDRAGYLLGYLFAIFANTYKIAFWLVTHLLCDLEAYQALQEEIDRGVEKEFGDLESLLLAHPRTLGGTSFPLLDSALKETNRLHTLPMSHRTAAASVELPNGQGGSFIINAGDQIVVNTTAVYWDEAFYGDAKKFVIGRFLDRNLTRYLYIFGRGRYIVSDF